MKYNSSLKIIKPLDIDTNPFSSRVHVKNSMIDNVLVFFPELEAILSEMKLALPEGYKRYLVDIHHDYYKSEKGTCVNADWHLDGSQNESKPEHYAIWVSGPDGSRTMFHPGFESSNTPFGVHSLEEKSHKFRQILGHELSDERMGFEIEDRTLYSYSRYDFHKGRILDKPCTRTLIRLVATDSIRPMKITRI